MNRARILLADDHLIVVEGLRSILSSKYELVGIVENGRDLVEAVKRLNPDVIVADITMPQLNGLDAVAQLRENGCKAKIVFLTMHKDATYASRAIAIGASAFVLKHSASTELLTAVQAALSGKTFVTGEIADQLAKSTTKRVSPIKSLSLTPRQREVLQLFAEGRTAREVANILHISVRTAENHKARIMDLLGLTTSAELVQYAFRHGFISAG
jgi:DNA-binding NarL/FixJ family response regulator